MWPHEARRLCITIDDQKIAVLLTSKKLEIIDKAEYEIQCLELYQSLIFNPYYLQNFIDNFLRRHAIKNIQTVVLLGGSVLHEIVRSDPNDTSDFYGIFQWSELGDQCWYGAGLSYVTWLQLTLLFMGTNTNVITMAPYFVVMCKVVGIDNKIVVNGNDDVYTIQKKFQTLLDEKYPLATDKEFLLPGLNALFDS